MANPFRCTTLWLVYDTIHFEFQKYVCFLLKEREETGEKEDGKKIEEGTSLQWHSAICQCCMSNMSESRGQIFWVLWAKGTVAMAKSTCKSHVLRVKHVSILLPNSKRFPLNLGKQPNDATISSKGWGDFSVLRFRSLSKKTYHTGFQ